MSRWNSGEIWFALVLILIGVLLLAGNLGLVAFDWSLVWPLALIFFGVWFIWRAFQPLPTSGASYGIGSYCPDLTGRAIQNENFSHGFGDFDLDLTRATISPGTNVVRASIGLGDLTVMVPRAVALRVKASAGLGDVAVLTQKDDGIGPKIEFQSDDYATATTKLDLEASAGVGEVRVIRGE